MARECLLKRRDIGWVALDESLERRARQWGRPLSRDVAYLLNPPDLLPQLAELLPQIVTKYLDREQLTVVDASSCAEVVNHVRDLFRNLPRRQLFSGADMSLDDGDEASIRRQVVGRVRRRSMAARNCVRQGQPLGRRRRSCLAWLARRPGMAR